MIKTNDKLTRVFTSKVSVTQSVLAKSNYLKIVYLDYVFYYYRDFYKK